MTKYTLLTDDSKQSKEAYHALKEAKIDFQVATFQTDEDLRPPVLFIPEGRCEGLNCIIAFAQNLKIS